MGYLKNGLLWVGQRTLFVASHKSTKKKSRYRRKDSSDSIIGLGGDVERLGKALEKGEQGRGHDSSLTVQIAREISWVARNVGTMPEAQYEWHDWVRWLGLLGIDSSQGAEGALDDMQDWLWLADDGPLFSRVTETEWVLSKLCARLEKVLEEEMQDQRRRNNISTRDCRE